MTTTLDFFASKTQYLDHLAPIWSALPADHRGDFLAGAGSLVSERAALDYGITTEAPDRGRDRTRTVVVASYGDLRAIGRRSSVFVEHGAGQIYYPDGPPHPSSPGGPGRDSVRLFVVPNLTVAARNSRFYRTTPNAVVGCPKLDPWHRNPPTPWTAASGRPPVVALSFRWPCGLAPECRGALDHYRGALRRVAEAFPGAIGHAHPNHHADLYGTCRAAGLEPVARFSEVLDRADIYCVDNSSTMFEFASTGRPVVVLNAPWYRRDVSHGLRFWDAADVGIGVDNPDELVDTIRLALTDPPDVAERRRARAADVYAATDGAATRRAVDAIVAVVDSGEETDMVGPAHFRVHRRINGVDAVVVVTADELTADERAAFGLGGARDKARRPPAPRSTQPTPDMPTPNASAAVWRAYRLATGWTVEQLDGLGRNALRDLPHRRG